jgi:hypothetical protein
MQISGRQSAWWQRIALCVASYVLCTLAGCGDSRPATYPVQGTVKFTDGDPVPVGIVEFRAKTTGEKARGKLDPHGRFSLKTFGDKDGALPGEHQVVVIQHFDPHVWKTGKVPGDAVMPEGEHHEHDHPAEIVDRRYAAYNTSPLMATVKPQEENVVVLEVKSAPAHQER